MRKIYTLLLTLLLIIIFNNENTFAMSLNYDGVAHEYTAKPITLIVGGQPVVNTQMPPIILDGRTLVPAREIFENLGASVKWDAKYKQVYVTYKNKMIILTINNKIAYINQVTTQMDVPAKLINDKTMIPVAFVARNLGFDVNWDERTRVVSIQGEGMTVVDQSKVVLGYATYYYNGDKSSYNSMVVNKNLLDQVITQTYTVDGQGNLTGLISKEQINLAKANDIQIEASVSNQFDSKVAKSLLEVSENRTRLINNILVEIKKYGYAGICIDIECIYPSDRDYMTEFMKELYITLQPKGYLVTIDLPAKTYDDKAGAWQGAFDYKALAQYADQFVLMTYDEHYPQGMPGSIASKGWVEDVVEYATSVIPKEKILLGLAAYGYDWSKSGTKAYSTSKAYSVARIFGATINWDPISASAYYKYTDNKGIEHVVWFENENSIVSKLNIVNDYNLQGVSIWELGYVTSEYMKEIGTVLHPHPLW
ncbi:MAG: hypothetical protein A2Y24_01265 [Clostridiales bacterium GWE2_32_10]|nr:MAG: hypothetical protein A2Y24_01265 [Clostridiales bacterium GWE2_32_10]